MIKKKNIYLRLSKEIVSNIGKRKTLIIPRLFTTVFEKSADTITLKTVPT